MEVANYPQAISLYQRVKSIIEYVKNKLVPNGWRLERKEMAVKESFPLILFFGIVKCF